MMSTTPQAQQVLHEQNKIQGRLKSHQQGMTLIEVLVSIIILTIGIVALMTVQLRTVSGVREAEAQTIVAQAVQNLIEGMLASPDLSATTQSSAQAAVYTKPTYRAYLGSGDCRDSSTASENQDSQSFDEFRQTVKSHFLAELPTHLLKNDCTYSISEEKGETIISVEWLEETDDGQQQHYSYRAKVSK